MVSSQVNLGLPLAILQKAIISEATWKEKSSNKATSSYISSIKLKANFLLYIKFFFFLFLPQLSVRSPAPLLSWNHQNIMGQDSKYTSAL